MKKWVPPSNRHGVGMNSDYLESGSSNKEVNCEEGGPYRKRNHDGSV